RLAGENAFGRGPLEWRAAEQREVRRRGERVQVRPLLHPFTQELFWRGELRRSAARSRAPESGVAAQRQRQPEVRDAQPPVRLDQHVLRLQVPVDQAERVRV